MNIPSNIQTNIVGNNVTSETTTSRPVNHSRMTRLTCNGKKSEILRVHSATSKGLNLHTAENGVEWFPFTSNKGFCCNEIVSH